jgi:hypothetical protein
MSKSGEYQVQQDIFQNSRYLPAVAADAKQRRDEFVESTQSRLEVLDHELGRLDQQSREAADDVRARWLITRTDLGRRRQAVWQRLDRFRSREANVWLHETRKLDDARQDLSAAIAEARKQLRQPR